MKFVFSSSIFIFADEANYCPTGRSNCESNEMFEKNDNEQSSLLQEPVNKASTNEQIHIVSFREPQIISTLNL